ncbi:sulfatase family protein [Pontiella agarivorans]|uniref:Arylsulfatase n=1 Tax=Pontiella agarivorans TaxID=3038953 RepID=A0ABU5MS28_9BACT|nr:arylsulfatase [Pontiella agarivorans]MDZ8117004.1 arylsulfatase [Pontiella agarivorans]
MKMKVTATAVLFLMGAAQAVPPNIVYILADDMGPGDVSCYNAEGKISTPNIDRLAREGMKFMDMHTNSSVCTPTRYGILTGRYAWRTSQLKMGVLNGYSQHLIEPTRETVASLLKKQGYATACIGKWHLGMDWQQTPGSHLTGKKISWKKVDPKAPIKNGPNSVGFDYFYGISGSLNMSPHAYIENDRMQGEIEKLAKMDDVNARGFTQPSTPGYAAKEYVQQEVVPRFTRKATDWIRENKDGPFFLYFPLPSPHSPLVPNAAFKGKSGLNLHGDFCLETDWAVGEVLKTLDELDLTDNTLVVFTADNGTSPRAGFEELAAKGHHPSWIYRGMKGTTWEGGHRVPFVVRWPQQVKAGAVSSALICSTDFFATCAELTGVKPAPDAGEDSVSFLPALQGRPQPGSDDRLVIHHSDKGIFSIRRGTWKVMFDAFGGSGRYDPRASEPIRNIASLQLYDMASDATENVNLAAQYPEIVQSLRKDLAGIIRRGRSTPGPNLPSDYNDPNVAWPQLEPVLNELK